MTSLFEVELKYAIENESLVVDGLAECGFELSKSESHVDTYFEHPCRDFRQTGEALRLRWIDGQPFVTYKGSKLDTGGDSIDGTSLDGVLDGVKVRREIEWPLSPGDQDGALMGELLQRLGFVEVAKVRKFRKTYCRAHSTVVVTIDQVEELGLFAEVEAICEHESDREPSMASVSMIATQLGLSKPETKSYLRLLMERGLESSLEAIERNNNHKIAIERLKPGLQLAIGQLMPGFTGQIDAGLPFRIHCWSCLCLRVAAFVAAAPVFLQRVY